MCSTKEIKTRRNLMKTVVLNSGYEMPVLGLGTWPLKGNECTEVVKTALQLGYRHIDTAADYQNHADIGRALQESDIERSDLFITSKVSRGDLHYDDFLRATERILAELAVDYLDLLLIHWPNKEIPLEETLRAMARLQEEGKVRSLGVSNFTQAHIRQAMRAFPDLISVNQVEFHPYLYQKELLNFCREHHIVLTAYSPLAQGRIFKDQRVKELTDKYGFSPSQLVLKWLLDKGIVVIPKASSPGHLKDNLDVLDLDIDAKVLGVLDGLNENMRLIFPDFHEFDLE